MPKSGVRARVGASHRFIPYVLWLSAVSLLLLVGLELVVGRLFPPGNNPYFRTDVIERLEPSDPPLLIHDSRGKLVASPLLPGINPHGYRTPPFAEEPLGRPTVMFIGDSFTWGASATPLEKGYVDLVRAAGYKTINLGIPAIGMAQYIATAEEYIPALKPDAVCLMFYPENDFQVEPPVAPGVTRGYSTNVGFLAAFDLLATRPLTFEEAADYYYYSFLPQHPIRHPLHWLRQSSLVRAANYIRIGVRHEKQQRWVLEQLKAIRALAETNGAQFFLFLLPVRPKYRDSAAMNVSKLFHELQPLTPVNAFEDKFYLGENDVHFNNDGHAKMACFILESLLDAQLLPHPELDPLQPRQLSKSPSLEEVRAALNLSDKQVIILRERLNNYQKKCAALLFPQANGKTSLGSWAASAFKQFSVESEWHQALAIQLAQRPEGKERSYAELIDEERKTFLSSLDSMWINVQLGEVVGIDAKRIADTFTGSSPIDELLKSRVIASHYAKSGLPVDDEGHIQFTDLAAALALDTTQQRAAEDVLRTLKLQGLDLLAKPPQDSDAAPLDMIAHALHTRGQADAEMNKLGSLTIQGSGRTYLKEMDDLTADAASKFLAILHPEQRDKFQLLPLAGLMLVELQEDPFQEGIAARVKQFALSKRNDSSLNWALFAESLELTPEQDRQARELVNVLKQKNRDILSAKPANHLAAPLEILDELTKSGGDVSEFGKYASDQLHPVMQKPYTVLLQEAELETRSAIFKLLDAQQKVKFLQHTSDSLAQIDTGFAPNTMEN